MRAEFAARATWLNGQITARKSGNVAVMTAEGRGEVARAIATAAVLPAPKTGIDLFVPYDGTAAKHDMCAKAAENLVIAQMIPTPDLPRTIRLKLLLQHYREVWDMCSLLPVSHDPYGHIHIAADYGDLYYGYPQANWRLKYLGETWWEIAGSALGIEVDPRGLKHAAPDGDCCEIDDSLLPPQALCGAWDQRCKDETGNWSRAKLAGVPKYAVIATGAGAGSQVKCAPKALWDVIIGHLGRLGVRCVQVGAKSDGVPAGDPIDRRGTRLPLVNRILKGALCFIGNEGFLHYMAYGLGVPAVALFGPTPMDVYGFSGNLNLIRDDGHGHAACPLGTCFWGGGFAAPENWARRCMAADFMTQADDGKPLPVNPDPLACMNMPHPEVAAGAIGEFVMARMAQLHGMLRGPFPSIQVAGQA